MTKFLPQESKMGERLYCIKNNIKERVVCPVCNSNVRYKDGKYFEYCSLKCSNNSIKVKDKKKKAYQEKYGVDHISKSQYIKEKVKQTHQERYGGYYNNRDKAKKTNHERYGAENPGQNDEIKEKIKKVNLDRYGTPTYAQSLISEFSIEKLNDESWMRQKHHTEDMSMVSIGIALSVSPTTVRNYLNKHGIEIVDSFSSVGQNELVEFVESLGVNILKNDRTMIYPYELDILIPDYNMAIEYNGLFWHSEVNKDVDYHLNKTRMCEERDIRLIQIFEDEWLEYPQKCKDTIRHLLGKSERGVYARNCIIKEIEWKEAKSFLDKYHLLNAGSSGNYRIGAFDDEKLIGVMVFGRANNEKSEESVELKRFVTDKRNHPGLGSKMFKYAIKQKGYDNVIAFVDRRWFTGLVKNHIGFVIEDETEPSIWWTNFKNRYHRRFITKRKLVNEGADNSKSKRQLLLELGFVRIWDAGKLKLRWVSP